MLTVLSPAKSLDYESKLPTRKHSEPRLLGQSDGLIEIMRTKTPADISHLMHISDDLAHLNATRYAQWSREHTLKNSRQAVLAFNGDVYQGMQAYDFDARDFTDAQKTLRILSGLYGLLRPLDLIEPYRLEMGTKLASSRGRTLYDWWGTQVTDLLAKDLEASPGSPVLVNLASNEYAKVIDQRRLGARVVSPRFEDRDKNGEPRIVSFFAKRARGSMAGWMVRNRVRSAAKLADFDVDGYSYDEARSSRNEPVFVR
ncbi:peroxide stress protein YaaA [Tessaracoccus aquimaris]|uniref:UPF0246 protein BW730_15310 n=1 Tax=Tessaracoccus aquimaris TaxID=1332264 RepID=A0A1Q2CRA7_9ACTN|nr:peroxide stress protein YaaA [Tessaracoccus aquimaris]AQP48668.1 peroxide stress protein YaaA [Tessaracoccus aquimaris]